MQLLTMFLVHFCLRLITLLSKTSPFHEGLRIYAFQMLLCCNFWHPHVLHAWAFFYIDLTEIVESLSGLTMNIFFYV